MTFPFVLSLVATVGVVAAYLIGVSHGSRIYRLARDRALTELAIERANHREKDRA